MKKLVYVVLYDWEYTDNTQDRALLGIYTTKELAIEAAKKLSKGDAFGNLYCVMVQELELDNNAHRLCVWSWLRDNEEEES